MGSRRKRPSLVLVVLVKEEGLRRLDLVRRIAVAQLHFDVGDLVPGNVDLSTIALMGKIE